MTKKAILFGSIGAVAETSDIQREAYNSALSAAGLDWQWDRDTYSQLLESAGGKERLDMLSSATSASLSDEQIESIHASKTEAAGKSMREQGVSPRPGVAELIAHAKEQGMKVGFVTTTYEPNIDAVFDAAGDSLSRDDFDYIGTRGDVEEGKPSPDCYQRALDQLGVSAEDCLAIEDTANSVMSAKRAGIDTIATPGALTSGQDFWQADAVVDQLSDGSGQIRSEVTNRLS